MDRDVADYYAQGGERDRLEGWSLERIRSERLLRRYLPAPPARVLDVGGGAGRYAAWLAAEGWQVTMLDPVEVHVAQASAQIPGCVERGDALGLPHADGSFDAVLVMGPLYHLERRADRVAALAEAIRVVRPGGVVVVAAISRMASMLDGLGSRAYLGDVRFRETVVRDLACGSHTNPTRTEGWFTTAHFHRVADLVEELAAAGLVDVAVFGVEGPAWVFGDRGREPDDESWRDAALWAAEAVERDPDFVPMSAHLLAIGRR